MRRLPATVFALTFVLGACVPPEPEVNLAREYDEETVMGEIQAAEEITIGIPDDAYPLGYADQNGAAQGFTAELGREIAKTLDVEPRFITGSSEQLLDLPEEGLADITFPAIPITESLARQHQVTDPYYVAHQRLLVPATGYRIIESIDELGGETVCSVTVPGDTEVPPDAIEPSIEVVEAEPQQCLHFLREGEVRAVTGPDYILAGLRLGAEREFTVVGDELTTVGLGAVLERGAPGWTDFVNAVLELAKEEGLWETAYRENLLPALAVEKEPPDITAEEAAALYPNDVE